MILLDAISIILCQTSHPGNIGSVARAMKNMGLTRLKLVAPLQFPHAKATELASGADDILQKAEVFQTLEEAVRDTHWLYATSARQRIYPWPQVTVKEAVPTMLQATANSQQVGIVFGPERTGLHNDDLQRCDFHITIPAHPVYSSLNLAQAVQVVSYEIYQGSLVDTPMSLPTFGDKATAAEVDGLLQHFKETALALGFMDPEHPQKLMPRLQRLFAKTQLEKDEINILRGMLRLIKKTA